MITLQQLRVFWAVAHAPSLTRAAKQLGLTQPSLSQQLARLEAALGRRLFERAGGQLILNDAGRYLLRKAETVLAEVDEAEAALAEFGSGRRGRIALGGAGSAMRALVPAAYLRARGQFPALELDVHELSPREALEQLWGRNLTLALIAADAIADGSHSFVKLPLCADPQVLAAPAGLDLGRTLAPADAALLRRCIQFSFGNTHTQRVEAWYRRILPHHQIVAECRSFETAAALVQGGVGVALMPLLAATFAGRLVPGIEVYATDLPDRQIVALVPSQYRRIEPHATFLEALVEAGRSVALPPVRPMPPFLAALPRAAE
jgi:LysR family transcriptional activator of glutamate synthase operon